MKKRHSSEQIVVKLHEAFAVWLTARAVGAPPLPPDLPAREPYPILSSQLAPEAGRGHFLRSVTIS